jgi:hypothetical protein
MTVSELIKILKKANPEARVFASYDSIFPIEVVVQTTLGDPSLARYGGDPAGSPAVALINEKRNREWKQQRRERPVPGDVTKVLGSVT